MNKKDLISAVATDRDITKKDAEEIINATLDIIKGEIKKGEKVSILGFGNFEPKTNSARTGINPQTKEPMQINASNSVKFKVGKAFKDSLND